MMKRILLTTLFVCLATVGWAQKKGSVSATLYDAETGETVIGAVVAYNPAGKPDNTKYVTSGYNGSISIPSLAYGSYEMKISFLGYNDYTATFDLSAAKLALGRIDLKPGVQIEAVVKEVQAIRASQKGDTVSYNAGAFKVANDADVEGLLKKMPGITVTDGTVEAQGEEVKKIFVDGKEFFGEDVTTAIKSLPAEAVDRIEVYNKLSDAAEFSGMDDGEGYKALNIVTHRNMRQGQFGKMYAGLGYDAEKGADDRLKYLAGGNVNIFSGTTRLSILALFNNVNQQNFSFEDILGVSGGGGGRGVGQYMTRPQSGIAKVNAFGLNFSDAWGKRDQVTVQGSYFFNNTNTHNRSSVEKWYEAPMLPDTLMTQGASDTEAYNHRFNARIEWKISENQNLMIRPNFSFQSNDPWSMTQGWQFGAPEEGGSGYSRTDNFNTGRRNGYNLGTNAVYRAKLGKAGRTITINGRVRYSDQQNKTTSYSNQMGTLQDRPDGTLDIPWGWDPADYTRLRYLRNLAPSSSLNLSGEFSYTEPVSKYSQVSLQYRTEYQHSERDKASYVTGEDYAIDGLLPDPALSNNYESNNMNHRIGPGFRYSKERNTFVANLFYQHSMLDGKVISGQTFGSNEPIKHNYDNLTYFLMGQLNINQENSIRLYVNSNTSTPSITNLQNVFDVSDAQSISRGNPYLKPSYSHSVNFHYTNSNLEKGRTFMWMFSLNSTSDFTATHLVQSTQEKPIVLNLQDTDGHTETYTPNYYSMPVNLDGSWSLRTMISYGLPVNFLKSNFNIMAGVNYSKTPSIVGGTVLTDGTIEGGERNDSRNMGYSLRTVLGSNISEKVDFTLSWGGNYNEATNSLAAGNAKNRYFNHSVNANMKFVLPWNFTFTASASYSQYLGITNDYNETYTLCNIYLGKKIFKSKRGEIMVGVNDLFNQNNAAFSRTTGSGYTQNSTNLSMGRYYMVQFTYNLRRFGKKGSSNMSDYESQDQREFRSRSRMMGPPPGGGGGFGGPR